VPHEERQRRYGIYRHRFIQPPDLREDPTFALNSYNWSTFGTWEFDPRRHAGYLCDIDFFNREQRVRFGDDEKDEDGASEEERL
jgi:hypothetical protein